MTILSVVAAGREASGLAEATPVTVMQLSGITDGNDCSNLQNGGRKYSLDPQHTGAHNLVLHPHMSKAMNPAHTRPWTDALLPSSMSEPGQGEDEGAAYYYVDCNLDIISIIMITMTPMPGKPRARPTDVFSLLSMLVLASSLLSVSLIGLVWSGSYHDCVNCQCPYRRFDMLLMSHHHHHHRQHHHHHHHRHHHLIFTVYILFCVSSSSSSEY